MRLLLLSNSKNPNQGYLDHAAPFVRRFLGKNVGKVLFVPYAGVTISFDDYAATVRSRFRDMGYDLSSIHDADDALAAVRGAQAIAVGGGNTFRLLNELYENGVMDAIRERVTEGAPYIGWSAGSNVACPTIKTTNDMPIVQPPRLNAMGLVPFQVNPHYLDTNPTGHQGETREQRLLEFIEVNPDVYVVGLREGSILRVEGADIELLGKNSARVFKTGDAPAEYAPGDSLAFLMK